MVVVMSIPSYADDAGDAISRLRASDELAARGRLGAAYSGYLDLMRRYPTWWIAILKSGIVAQALGVSKDAARSAADRAATLAPHEPFVAFVRALVALEREQVRPECPKESREGERPLSPGDLAVRLAMARAKWLEMQGKRDEAIREYRWIADCCNRCVAAVWRWARLSGKIRETTGDEGVLWEPAARQSLFPPRWRRAINSY